MSLEPLYLPSVSMYTASPPSPAMSGGSCTSTASWMQICVLPTPGGPQNSVSCPHTNPPPSTVSMALLYVMMGLRAPAASTNAFAVITLGPPTPPPWPLLLLLPLAPLLLLLLVGAWLGCAFWFAVLSVTQRNTCTAVSRGQPISRLKSVGCSPAKSLT